MVEEATLLVKDEGEALLEDKEEAAGAVWLLVLTIADDCQFIGFYVVLEEEDEAALLEKEEAAVAVLLLVCITMLDDCKAKHVSNASSLVFILFSCCSGYASV